MFDFHTEPKPTDDLAQRIPGLEQRIKTLEGAEARMRIELEQSQSRWKACCKVVTPKKDNLCPCQK
jgi:hypothetical protein